MSQSTIIAIVVVILVLGVAGEIFYQAYRMMQAEKKAKEGSGAPLPSTGTPPESVSPSTLAAPAVIPTWVESLAPKVEEKKEADLLELARVLMSPNGKVIIEINGKRYTHVKEISDPTIARSLKTLVDEMNRFLGVNVIGAHASAPPVSESPPVVNRPVKVVSVEEAKNLPLEKPSMDIFKQYRNLREREKQPEIKIKSVLEEIDELLQTKIAGTDFTRRGLKVSTHSDGTALFMLDGQGYHSVDELPEAEARSLVKQTVQEWEKK